MKEKKSKSMEEMAEELEIKLSGKGENNDLEEATVDQKQEGWPSEDENAGSFREENLGEDDWEDEEIAPMKPWVMAVALCGIVVLAAVICAVLWYFTHRDKGDQGEDNSSTISVSAENSFSGSAESDDFAGAGQEAFGEDIVNSSASTVESASAPDAAESSKPAESFDVPSAAESSGAASSSPQTATQPSDAVQEPISGTKTMEFTQSDGEVMPKDVINLRSEPSTLSADNIVIQVKNGEILSRTGVNEATGWTRIDYNGETLYAVTQYLTTDLAYKPPVQAADPNRVNTMDGRIILFTDCSDNITPKEYVNLRTEPSTSQGESTVRCQIANGEAVHRTGYSPDAGWSRVEYNGETLYVVSSYMYTVE